MWGSWYARDLGKSRHTISASPPSRGLSQVPVLLSCALNPLRAQPLTRSLPCALSPLHAHSLVRSIPSSLPYALAPLRAIPYVLTPFNSISLFTAADEWDDPPQTMQVRPAADDTYEKLFHDVCTRDLLRCLDLWHISQGVRQVGLDI